MRADDDGFVSNPRKITRTISASDDDLKVLLAKRFFLIFESGVIVIKHWRMHNTIRADRHKPTNYTEELAMLSIKENGSYTIKNANCNQSATSPQPVRNQVTDKTPHRLDQIRLDQVRLDQIRSGKNHVRARFNEAYPKNGSCVSPEIDLLLMQCVAKDSEEVVIEGTAAYGRYCEWKYDNQLVGWIKQAKNFLRDFDYLTDWDSKLAADKKQAQKEGRVDVDDSDLAEIINWRPENES
jgi:hypothetical protein